MAHSLIRVGVPSDSNNDDEAPLGGTAARAQLQVPRLVARAGAAPSPRARGRDTSCIMTHHTLPRPSHTWPECDARIARGLSARAESSDSERPTGSGPRRLGRQRHGPGGPRAAGRPLIRIGAPRAGRPFRVRPCRLPLDGPGAADGRHAGPGPRPVCPSVLVAAGCARRAGADEGTSHWALH